MKMKTMPIPPSVSVALAPTSSCHTLLSSSFLPNHLLLVSVKPDRGRSQRRPVELPHSEQSLHPPDISLIAVRNSLEEAGRPGWMGLAGVKCPLSVEGLEPRGRDVWTKWRRRGKKNGERVAAERGKEWSTLFLNLSLLLPLLPASDTFSRTSSPPSLPLPLRLRGRMMMNRLAARKQNISSRAGIGNWLSTSAEPWPHNRFKPARTSLIYKVVVD